MPEPLKLKPNIKLNEHIQFISLFSKILVGAMPVYEDEDVVQVYTVNCFMKLAVDLNDRTLVFVDDPRAFITDLYHATHDKRRELSLSLRENNQVASLVKEYDKLIEQIKHEHFRLKADLHE